MRTLASEGVTLRSCHELTTDLAIVLNLHQSSLSFAIHLHTVTHKHCPSWQSKARPHCTAHAGFTFTPVSRQSCVQQPVTLPRDGRALCARTQRSDCLHKCFFGKERQFDLN